MYWWVTVQVIIISVKLYYVSRVRVRVRLFCLWIDFHCGFSLKFLPKPCDLTLQQLCPFENIFFRESHAVRAINTTFLHPFVPSASPLVQPSFHLSLRKSAVFFLGLAERRKTVSNTNKQGSINMRLEGQSRICFTVCLTVTCDAFKLVYTE